MTATTNPLPQPLPMGQATSRLTPAGYVVEDVDPFCLSTTQLADIQARGRASDWASVLLPQYRAVVWWTPSGPMQSNATDTVPGTTLQPLSSTSSNLGGSFVLGTVDSFGRISSYAKAGVAYAVAYSNSAAKTPTDFSITRISDGSVQTSGTIDANGYPVVVL
jgi:hypothetical protein